MLSVSGEHAQQSLPPLYVYLQLASRVYLQLRAKVQQLLLVNRERRDENLRFPADSYFLAPKIPSLLVSFSVCPRQKSNFLIIIEIIFPSLFHPLKDLSEILPLISPMGTPWFFASITKFGQNSLSVQIPMSGFQQLKKFRTYLEDLLEHIGEMPYSKSLLSSN